MSVWNGCGIKCVLCATYEGGGLSVWKWGKGWSVWHYVCEGCVDQHCRIELSALSNRVAIDKSTCGY